MISQTAKNNILKNLAGIQHVTPRGTIYYSNDNNVDTYVGLAEDLNIVDGDVTGLTEPSASTGYKRYQIAQSGTKAAKVSLADGMISNTDTLYFDEAVIDYDRQPKYYFITGSATNGSAKDIFAWGEIVDEYGNPTVLNVKKNSLPIMRKGQLKISLTETEKPKYTLTLNYNGTEEQVANLYCIPALASSYVIGNVPYDIEGWYYDAEFTEAKKVGEPGASNQIPLNGNTTIYAKLQARSE